ncbi:hypothetical protein [Chitinibacter sp. ZOR0017]|uniref:hypothetical protein n=1 Tax=Chitinibacter sp. ZOR0017 TaxID=1339254 RepID=UPI0006484A76|nr:hypothetical protein [Chitinibacter sp. ZOR0017]
MKKQLIAVSVLLLSACGNSQGNTFNVAEGGNKIIIAPALVDGRTEVKNFFGVHSLWWETQTALADANGNLSTASVQALKTSMVSSIRYGGAVNEIDWQNCIKPVANTLLLKPASWSAPQPCLFGPLEYAKSLDQLNLGVSWHIANVVGYEQQETDLGVLSKSAAAYASYVKGASPSRTRYWEIGNELERGRLQWAADKIAQRSEPVIQSILQADPAAKIVVPLLEYKPDWISSDLEHNRFLVNRFKGYTSEFAFHMYYDNPPEGPSIINRLTKLADNITMMKQNGVQYPGVWLTEHARWPQGNPSDNQWSSNWYQTADANGVLSTADFLIGLSQMNGVRGAMWHGLRAGPWNFLNVNNGMVIPSNIAYLFKVFNLPDTNKALTTVSTASYDGDHLGKYAIRASVFSILNQSRAYRVWLINRSPYQKPVALSLRAVLPDGAVTLKKRELQIAQDGSTSSALIKYSEEGGNIKSGNLSLLVQPLSVMSFDIVMK